MSDSNLNLSRLTADAPLVLTRQQKHILTEFGRPDDPFEISINDEGWHYEITDAGRQVLREIREA